MEVAAPHTWRGLLDPRVSRGRLSGTRSTAASAIARVFCSETVEEGLKSPYFHILFGSDLCIKKNGCFRLYLNWNGGNGIFLLFMLYLKWTSLGYILQICFIKTLNIEHALVGDNLLCVCVCVCVWRKRQKDTHNSLHWNYFRNICKKARLKIFII